MPSFVFNYFASKSQGLLLLTVQVYPSTWYSFPLSMSTFQFCIVSPDAKSTGRSTTSPSASHSQASSSVGAYSQPTYTSYSQSYSASYSLPSSTSYSPGDYSSLGIATASYGQSPYAYVDPQVTVTHSSTSQQYQTATTTNGGSSSGTQATSHSYSSGSHRRS